jgi:hypothetical protein
MEANILFTAEKGGVNGKGSTGKEIVYVQEEGKVSISSRR